MFAVVETEQNGAFVRVVGVFDAPRETVEQYAAARCRDEAGRFVVEQVGRPAGLEMAGGEEFADGRPRFVPVL